jgi:hypothetical protein
VNVSTSRQQLALFLDFADVFADDRITDLELALVKPGAVCFQLDVISDKKPLEDLVYQIYESGACVSPVI